MRTRERTICLVAGVVAATWLGYVAASVAASKSAWGSVLSDAAATKDMLLDRPVFFGLLAVGLVACLAFLSFVITRRRIW